MSTPPVKFPKPNRSSGKPPVRKSDGNGSAPGPASEQNWRGLVLLSLTILFVVALFYSLRYPSLVQQEISQAQLFDLIKAGKVETIVNEPDPSTGLRMFTGFYKRPVSNLPNAPEEKAAFKVNVDLQLDQYLGPGR